MVDNYFLSMPAGPNPLGDLIEEEDDDDDEEETPDEEV